MKYEAMSFIVNEKLVDAIIKIGKSIGTFDGTASEDALRSELLMRIIADDPTLQPMIQMINDVVTTLLDGDLGMHAMATMMIVAREGRDKIMAMTVPGCGDWELIVKKKGRPAGHKVHGRVKAVTEPIMVKKYGR